MIAASVFVQLLGLVMDSGKRMSWSGGSDLADHLAEAIFVREGGYVPAVPFQNRPKLLNDVPRVAFGGSKVALQALHIGAIAGLHGTLDIPLSDRSVLLADAGELKRLAIGDRNAVPEEFEKSGIV